MRVLAVFVVCALCSPVLALETKDLVGIWRADFGALIEFRADHTYRAQFADEGGTGKWLLRSPRVIEMTDDTNKYCGRYTITKIVLNKLYIKGPEGKEIWTRLDTRPQRSNHAMQLTPTRSSLNSFMIKPFQLRWTLALGRRS